MLGVLNLSLSTGFLLNFGVVPTVWYFLLFCILTSENRYYNLLHGYKKYFNSRTAYLPRGSESTHKLLLVLCCLMFCRLLFVLLSIFCWPLCCLSVFHLRLLITPLASSKFSIRQFSYFKCRRFLFQFYMVLPFLSW